MQKVPQISLDVERLSVDDYPLCGIRGAPHVRQTSVLRLDLINSPMFDLASDDTVFTEWKNVDESERRGILRQWLMDEGWFIE